jgi:hypothetical protein
MKQAEKSRQINERESSKRSKRAGEEAAAAAQFRTMY